MNLRLKRSPGIYLVGFMGSGKSTVGCALAERLGWPFADLDDDIEALAGCTIPEIFDQAGEEEFRRLETEALAARVDSIRRGHPLVLALGGGAFTVARNVEMVAEHGVSIWLDAPLELARERIAGTEHRPLARDPEAFERRYEARRAAYARAAFRVDVRSNDVWDTVEAIMQLPCLAQEA